MQDAAIPAFAAVKDALESNGLSQDCRRATPGGTRRLDLGGWASLFGASAPE